MIAAVVKSCENCLYHLPGAFSPPETCSGERCGSRLKKNTWIGLAWKNRSRGRFAGDASCTFLTPPFGCGRAHDSCQEWEKLMIGMNTKYYDRIVLSYII